MHMSILVKAYIHVIYYVHMQMCSSKFTEQGYCDTAYLSTTVDSAI